MGLNEKFFKSADEEDEPFFNTVLYTGNASTRSITGVGFEPDFVWIKNRTTGFSSSLQDTVRGTGGAATLSSDGAWAEGTYPNYGHISAFNIDGFTLAGSSGSYGHANTNQSNNNYVAWCWKAGGAAVSNTDGDITSQVSANVANGFSIVSYTGNSSFGQTIGHGLGAQPQMVIHKNLSNARNWRTYAETLGATKYINLDETAAAGTYGSFNNTAPTSTVFSTTNSVADRATNFNGDNYIAYCFHSVPGVSKVGSYAGSNSNLQVDTGFQPSFLMIKNIDVSGRPWLMVDNLRTGYVEANSTATEGDTVSNYLSFNSTGFLLVGGTGSYINEAGYNWIYLAIA